MAKPHSAFSADFPPIVALVYMILATFNKSPHNSEELLAGHTIEKAIERRMHDADERRESVL